MATAFDTKAALLRIFVADGQFKDGQNATEWIVCRACEHGLAGASVLRGIGGFYANAPIMAPEFFDIKLAHPLLIEIVDQPEKIESFAAFLKGEVANLLMCRIPVDICMS